MYGLKEKKIKQNKIKWISKNESSLNRYYKYLIFYLNIKLDII